MRAPLLYGNPREQTGEDIDWFVITELSGKFWEFTGRYNLGVLYSSSLLNTSLTPKRVSGRGQNEQGTETGRFR